MRLSKHKKETLKEHASRTTSKKELEELRAWRKKAFRIRAKQIEPEKKKPQKIIYTRYKIVKSGEYIKIMFGDLCVRKYHKMKYALRFCKVANTELI